MGDRVKEFNESQERIMVKFIELPSPSPSTEVANCTNQYYIPWGDIAAASAMVTVPLIILAIVFRHIIEGLTQGGIKE